MARTCPVEACAKSCGSAQQFRDHVHLHRVGVVQGEISDPTLTSLGLKLCGHCSHDALLQPAFAF